ncbi:vacuolar amino acid transporter 1-like protein, partial [Tanacetum coccineum]
YLVVGYHVFCAAPLYSTPYALMEGGWVGIFLLVLYWFCAFLSSVALGTCMAAYPSLLPNYQAVGGLAYGRTGRTIVSVNEHLVILV